MDPTNTHSYITAGKNYGVQVNIVKPTYLWRAGKTNYSATRCSPKTESPTRDQLPTVEPEVLWTGSGRRRHAVACLYVGLCVVHGGPLLFTVFFTVVCAVVHDDLRQATVTLDSVKVTSAQQSVWRSGNGVGQINEVTLRRARLVLGWVTVRGCPSYLADSVVPIAVSKAPSTLHTSNNVEATFD